MLSRILGAVGAVLLIVGVVLAVRPVHAGGDSCGSIFQPDKGITPMQCDARLSTRGTLVTGFGAGGVALVVSALSVAAVRDRRTRVTS
ncbi:MULTISPECIES: hypothetical protein [Kribbella]|uniref:Uncharacterized protein n=2 Tax=Kribbella TaxID=182639 RepID=A0A4R0IQN6_9ACTN|nr:MULTISPECIES: hypothetical protein [Kribbella]TCC27067.1 hypothetical protein E0H58_03465 [Kribbella speibonae]TCC28761.1 hypothetical protein E0H50_28495 [Kribbella sindirgiensis]TCC36081.1 hypothetical protein E0H92_25720 [Kribbella speibonae]